MPKPKPKQVSVPDMLVRQVSALVQATADACHDPNDPKVDDVLTIEAQLYYVLAENCAAKQKLAEGFAKGFAKTRPAKGRRAAVEKAS
jgi:hypothetical protein